MDQTAANELFTNGACIVLGFVLNGVMNHVFGGGPELKKRLDTLEKNRVAAVEAEVKDIKAGCLHHKDQTDITELRTILDHMQTITARFEESSKELGENMATASEAIEGLKGYINDVRTEAREARRAVTEHERELHMRRPQ